MKRTNLTNLYQKFHRNRKSKNQEKSKPSMENDLDELLEYDDEFKNIEHSSTMDPKTDGVPLSVELAQASTSKSNSQEIFLRLPSAEGTSITTSDNDGAAGCDLELEIDDESIYENSSKAETPAGATGTTDFTEDTIDNEQILFEGESGKDENIACKILFYFLLCLKKSQ